MSLTAKGTFTLGATATVSATLESPSSVVSLALDLFNLTTGPLINQASQFWTARRTVTAGANDDLSVVTPAARDTLGTALALSRITCVYIRNRSVVAGDILKVGGRGTSVAWTSPFNGSNSSICTVRPDGTLLFTAPDATSFAAVASTNEILRINNPGANSIDYDIVIIGS